MPWPEMLRHAVAMGVTPDAFWRLSWREWRMLTVPPEMAALDRQGFNSLMENYPDERDR